MKEDKFASLIHSLESFAAARPGLYRLRVALLAALGYVYLLLVVNFQSWLDPFIILTALPGAMGAFCNDVIVSPDGALKVDLNGQPFGRPNAVRYAVTPSSAISAMSSGYRW